jgi:hypothetical protein
MDPKKSFDSKMVKVHLDEFLNGDKMHFSLYFKSSDFYLSIAGGGLNLTPEDVIKYKLNDIHFVYANKTEFMHFLGLYEYVSPKINLKQKQKVMRDALKKLEEFDALGELNRDAFLRAKILVETTLDILTDNQDMLDRLVTMKDNDGVLVALLTALISQYMGTISTPDRFKIIICGFLQDFSPKSFTHMPIFTLARAFSLTLKDSELTPHNFHHHLDRFAVSCLGIYGLKTIVALLLVFKREIPNEFTEYQLSKLGV